MNPKQYIHNSEGKDDMPAHIKTALTNTHLTLSVRSNQCILGTWQGIYLFEHRLNQQNRTILAHIVGD
jgi:secondary thiamine-phosphate synthase enzyme